jgi:hypothetical protein
MLLKSFPMNGHVSRFRQSDIFWTIQGLPGDWRDRAGARNRLPNNPWGVVNSAKKNKKK